MGEESIRIDGVGNLMPAVQSLAEKHKAGARAMLSCIETITAKYIRIQDDPIWERIDGYIDEHIHDRITVENISAEIFISPSTIYHRTDQAKPGSNFGVSDSAAPGSIWNPGVFQFQMR